MKTLLVIIALVALTATTLINTLGKKIKRLYAANSKVQDGFSNKKEK